MVTREEMKAEALSRMKKIGMDNTAVVQFEKNDRVFISIRGVLRAMFDTEIEMIQKWEQETGCLVYHAIYADSGAGAMLSLLFVSKYEEDWPTERQISRDGEVMGMYGYAMNLDQDMFSDYGLLWLANDNGVFFRVG